MDHVFIGNLTDDPDVSMSGTPRVVFSIATADRYRDAEGAWKSRPPTYFDCYAWRAKAQALATVSELRKGTPVIVVGRFRTSSWESGGTRHRKTVVDVQHVGVNLCLRAGRQEMQEPLNIGGEDRTDAWADTVASPEE